MYDIAYLHAAFRYIRRQYPDLYRHILDAFAEFMEHEQHTGLPRIIG